MVISEKICPNSDDELLNDHLIFLNLSLCKIFEKIKEKCKFQFQIIELEERYDFRYAKIAKISKLNYFYCSEYFFLKLHIQRLQVDSIRYSEFQEIFQKTESSRPHFLKMDHK